jgi:hypothetical protein
MKIKKLKVLIIFIVMTISVFQIELFAKESKARIDMMINKVVQNEDLKEMQAVYFKKLTHLFFDYLRSSIPEEELKPFYNVRTLNELKGVIAKYLGKNVIEYGEKMFSYFENEAAKKSSIQLKNWEVSTSDHFVFFVHPGSVAKAEIDFIKESSEKTFASLTRTLNIEKEVNNSLKVLLSSYDSGKNNGNLQNFQGKLAVFLHQIRKGEAAKKIGKRSLGIAYFGATILESGKDKGWGRLNGQIDVLYFNAFSQIVLDHEIAHLVLFLGSYEPGFLIETPLKGKSDLKKAFFKGYTSILPFIHEGIGDYVIYCQGFYQLWPILPKQEQMVLNILNSNRYISLKKMLKGDIRLRMKYSKEYSLEAASFIDFLIRTYGIKKLKKWYKTGERGINTFKEIYNLPIKEMEKKWHDFILKRLKTSS